MACRGELISAGSSPIVLTSDEACPGTLASQSHLTGISAKQLYIRCDGLQTVDDIQHAEVWITR